MSHVPVLAAEVVQFLDLKPGMVIMDGTLGLGGHAEKILQKIGPKGRYYGFDLDRQNLDRACERLADFSAQFTAIHDNFAHCKQRLQNEGITQLDAILLDLGLSSPHVDDPSRGFSIRESGPLDMRFNRSEGQTAADLVNQGSEAELKRIFYEYGEERYAPKLARMIVEQRQQAPLTETQEVMDLIAEIMKSSGDRRRMATRVFQALRIAVNRELEVLTTVLPDLLEFLAPGGRLAIISYHSLEDRIVKRAFKQAARSCVCPPEILRCECDDRPRFEILTKKPIVPSEAELESNPRSRSAKLRVIRRLTSSSVH